MAVTSRAAPRGPDAHRTALLLVPVRPSTAHQARQPALGLTAAAVGQGVSVAGHAGAGCWVVGHLVFAGAPVVGKVQGLAP